jgi:hypothetical protein
MYGLQLRLPRYAVHIANAGVTCRSQLGSGVAQHSGGIHTQSIGIRIRIELKMPSLGQIGQSPQLGRNLE